MTIVTSPARPVLPAELGDRPVLAGLTLDQYLDHLADHHPRLLTMVALGPGDEGSLAAAMDGWDGTPGHFEDEGTGGRGGGYRSAQCANPLVRARGIRSLFELALGSDTGQQVVIDALGGNGTLTRAARELLSVDAWPYMVTADVSPAMVASALFDHGLPAVRQAAQRSLLRDGVASAVIMAYGTHHIADADRAAAVGEGWRLLRPGGRLVLQDFEEGSPTARWYSEVLDRHTTTGHRHHHFTVRGLEELFGEAGFAGVAVHRVYDPIVAFGASRPLAVANVVQYLVDLFGLVQPPGAGEEARPLSATEAEELATRAMVFDVGDLPPGVEAVRRFTVVPCEGGFRAELPRVALVAVGTRR